MGQRVYNQDLELILADGVAMTASGVTEVATVDQVKKVGPGRFEAVLIVDVSAIKISANDEIYTLLLQGSSAEAFSTHETLASLALGATEVRPGGAVDSVIGRYEIPFTTEQHDTVYDWIRLYVVTAGTDETITLKAWIAERY